MRLERTKGLAPLGGQYRLGPAGQRIRDAFRPAADGGYRVFWGRSKDLRTTMEAAPERNVADKKEALAARYRQQAGHLLLAAKFNTQSGRLVAIFSAAPALGSMWVPVQARTMSVEEAKALCAWCNGTLGMLGFLMRRGSTLMNPSFSQADLATLPVPDFKAASAAVLASAYEDTRRAPMKPWKNAADDDMRDRLDKAAARTTGIDIERIRDLRVRISREPTVSNEPIAFD